MSFLFGSKATPSTQSSTQQSTSSSMSNNVNNPLITSTYTPQMQQGVTANNYLSSLLTGQGDTQAAKGGYSNYLQMAGFQPALTALSRNITGQGAASGLLNSGSTALRLQKSGAELNNQFANNYLQQLSGLSNQGLQAGGLVANTGQQSTSQSQSTGSSQGTGGTEGTPGLFGSILGAAATVLPKIFPSDRRLKRDIELVGREADGLGVYLCRYVWSKTRRVMVMADEVAKLRPWALGPKWFGYATVDYGAL
jgi:hypothetical protein